MFCVLAIVPFLLMFLLALDSPLAGSHLLFKAQVVYNVNTPLTILVTFPSAQAILLTCASLAIATSRPPIFPPYLPY
jgi:hypothetical protein